MSVTNEKERADISKQVLVIDGKIEMCKDANLLHQYKVLYAKYIETKKIIKQYHDSMIAPPNHVEADLKTLDSV